MPIKTRIRTLFAAAAALGAAGVMLATPAAAQPVGVSVNIGQPGFYGRIDIGGSAPPPQLIYPQPIVVQPPPRVVQRTPIYLRVPPHETRDWARYCARYQACGQPVYFMQDRWYRDVYAPYWRERERHWHRDWRDERRRDRDDDWRRRDRHDDRRWDDDGPRGPRDHWRDR